MNKTGRSPLSLGPMAFQWLALKRAPASSIKAVLAELVGQTDDAKTGPIALFGVLAVTHHDLGEDRDVRPDTGGPTRAARAWMRCGVQSSRNLWWAGM